MLRNVARAALTSLLLGTLAACGGGSTLTSTTPGKVSPGSARTYPVSISLFVPNGKTIAAAASLRASSIGVAATGRRPLYLPSSVHSVSIQQTESAGAVVTGAPVVILVIGGSSCTTSASGQTCTATLQGALGQDAWAVKSFVSGDGTGTAISLNTGTLTVLVGVANVLTLTLNPILASLAFVPTAYSANATTAATLPLVLNAKDLTGATIIGPGTFVTAANVANPITLASSSAAHAIVQTSSGTAATATISTTSNDDLAQIAYDGTLVAGTQTITASSPGVATATITLTLTLAAGGLSVPTTITLGEDLGTTSTTLAISEPGYGGTFTLTSASCTGIVTFPGTAGPGPNVSPTITQAGGGTCTITVTDGTNTGSVIVKSTTLGIVLQ